MLEDKDRIFQNLYNDGGSDLNSAKIRGDWNDTKKIWNYFHVIPFLICCCTPINVLRIISCYTIKI